jgi:hypothetical protein
VCANQSLSALEAEIPVFDLSDNVTTLHDYGMMASMLIKPLNMNDASFSLPYSSVKSTTQYFLP